MTFRLGLNISLLKKLANAIQKVNGNINKLAACHAKTSRLSDFRQIVGSVVSVGPFSDFSQIVSSIVSVGPLSDFSQIANSIVSVGPLSDLSQIAGIVVSVGPLSDFNQSSIASYLFGHFQTSISRQ